MDTTLSGNRRARILVCAQSCACVRAYRQVSRLGCHGAYEGSGAAGCHRPGRRGVVPAAPGEVQGMVPPRAGPVEPGSGLRAGRGLGPPRLPVAGRGAQRALRQPADRGQPPVLLPRHQLVVHRGRHLGRVEPAVDGRGASPFHRHPRLDDGDPSPRPGGAGTGPHGPGVDRIHPEGPTIQDTCEGVVYVTLQELATRISHRNTGRLLGDSPGARSWPGWRPTRTCTSSSTGIWPRP